MGVTVAELAYLRLLGEHFSKVTPLQIRTMLFLLEEKQSYFTLEEIEHSTKIHNGQLKKIMKQFTSKRLVEKEGCLFKKPENSKIVALISCK